MPNMTKNAAKRERMFVPASQAVVVTSMTMALASLMSSTCRPSRAGACPDSNPSGMISRRR